MDIPRGFKRCTVCKEVLPLEDFPKNKRSKDGFWHMCKKCNNKRNRKYQQAKKIEKYLKDSQTTLTTVKEKRCAGCGEVLPSEEFYKNHRNKDGLSYKCKKCLTKQSKEYQIEKLKERGW